jgi:hypothetical protein
MARSAGTTSAGHVITGGYEILFNQDISNCVYLATIGNPGVGNPPNGEIAVAQRTSNAKAVYVETRNDAGTLTDTPFHLAVIC